VLGYNNNVSSSLSVRQKYSLSDKTTITLINPFLKKEFQKKGKKENINVNHIRSVLFSLDKHIIKKSNHLNYFKGLHSFFLEVKKNLENIIIASPKDIERMIDSNVYRLQNEKNHKKCIENIFRYEEFTDDGFQILNEKWNSYELTNSLGISVCPYCNRNWINTVQTASKDKIINPQLDHFFCKADYPLFRLSFYNLIPSCDSCNTRLKKAKKFNLTEYIHPYFEGYGTQVSFHSVAKNVSSSLGLSNEFSVSLIYKMISADKKDRIEKSRIAFKIKEIYENHGDIIGEIFRKKHLFSIKYLESLRKTITEHNIPYDEMYKIAFGNYYDEIDFKKRSFAKLTKDIAIQLGMVNVDRKY
jgi:hypothetical protein